MISALKMNEKPASVSLELPVSELLSLAGPRSAPVSPARGMLRPQTGKRSAVSLILPKKTTDTLVIAVGAAVTVKLVSSAADQVRELKQNRQIKKMKKRIDELEERVQELEKELAVQ